jgi:hypothetical protein
MKKISYFLDEEYFEEDNLPMVVQKAKEKSKFLRTKKGKAAAGLGAFLAGGGAYAALRRRKKMAREKAKKQK